MAAKNSHGYSLLLLSIDILKMINEIEQEEESCIRKGESNGN